jgi:prophage antirepressor
MKENKLLKVFEHNDFGALRSYLWNDEPWFVGVDVARSLGYKNPSKALITHCDSEKFIKQYIPHISGVGGASVFLINQTNIIRLVMKSKQAGATRFQDWVFDEVIPSILTKGSYSIKPSPNSTVKSEPTKYSTLEVAESFGLIEFTLNCILKDLGVLEKDYSSGGWVLTERFFNPDLVVGVWVRKDGRKPYFKTYWTDAGVEFIKECILGMVSNRNSKPILVPQNLQAHLEYRADDND